MIIKRIRHRIIENDGDDIIEVHPRKHKDSTIRLALVNSPTYDAEFIILPSAEELRSKIAYSDKGDEIARDIMKVCIGQITNGYTLIQSGHLIENKLVVGHAGYRELKVQPFRLLYRICTKHYKDGTKKKVVVALNFFKKQTEQLTQQDIEKAKKAFIQWRIKEMESKEYTKIESLGTRKSRIKTESTKDTLLPSSEEREKIILDMLLKGCYVSDIYERFGVECPYE